MSGWDFLKGRRSTRKARPPAASRPWIHPSELPSFEALPDTTQVRRRSLSPRIAASLVAVLLVVGAVVLMTNRGPAALDNNLPAHLATTLKALPAVSRDAAGSAVDLTITIPGHVINVAALALPHDLAVTTIFIPVNALISGSTASKVNFPVTLIGRDNVMGFSIVHLGVAVTAPKLDALPSSTTVIAVAPIEKGSTKAPEYDWSMTTLGDPLNNAQGVVHYLATKTYTSLSKDVDAIAVDTKGNVVAVLSSRHSWYAATFVAQVAAVVASGGGCHADLGILGKDEQGGGVLVTSVKPYSAAAHADLKVGDVITGWNGKNLNTWDQLVSTLYLTPAYTSAKLTFDQKTTVHHADVSLGCPSKLVP
ncbi:MAG TPA: PDZ domain-containing protein [Acidimicrobiales bacterium]|nr:PDZ domain-containing protein [Acidimicrobiales bacterium]